MSEKGGFKFAKGMYYFPDKVDEMTEFHILERAEEPLLLNFSRLKSINSYGIRNFIKFVRSWEPRRFEFYECTPVFIDAVNVVLNLVGTSGDSSCIKSFYIPHIIDGCKQCESASQEFIFDVDDVDFDNLEVAERKCQQCNQVMEPDVELDEYLAFFESMKPKS